MLTELRQHRVGRPSSVGRDIRVVCNYLMKRGVNEYQKLKAIALDYFYSPRVAILLMQLICKSTAGKFS